MVKLQEPITRIGGLQINDNPLSVPEGSLRYAQNCVNSRPGIVENRRGMKRLITTSNAITSMGEFRDLLHYLDGTTLKRSNAVGVPYSYSGSFAAPAGHRMRFRESTDCVYFTSSSGLKRLDAFTSNPVEAGMPPGLDLQLAQASGSWFTNNKQVGYRLVWVKYDANNRPIAGAPSHRQVHTNTSGGAIGIQLTSTIPDGILSGDKYRIYRTDLSASQTTDPGDEHFLVIEKTVLAGDITNKYVQYTDDNFFLYDSLYTNPTEETLSQANENPPQSKDFCMFKGYPHFSNTSQEHYLLLTLISLNNLVVDSGDTVTIAGDVYTFSASEDLPNKKFKLETGLGSLALNIAATAKNLCRCVNRTSTTTYAFYISGINDDPGMMEFRARTFSGASFAITANDANTGADFSPELPTTGTTVSSVNDAKGNRLYHGKRDIPDSVPYLNYDDIGAVDNQILRVLPLQDSMIIAMESGIWRRSGDSPSNYSDKVLDPQIRCLAPDSWVVLNNMAYGLTDQGIVQVSENGIAIVSSPIEVELKKIFSYSNFQTITHATSYPSERLYVFWCQENSSDQHAKIAWVFNFLTQGGEWSGPWRKNISGTHLLRDSDLLYLAKADETYILQERKTYGTSLSDYSDEAIPVTITAAGTAIDDDGDTVSTATVTYSYSLATLAVGWILVQGIASSQIMSCTDNGDGTFSLVMFEQMPGLATGSADVEMPIPSLLQLAPKTGGNPMVKKDFVVVQAVFEDESALFHKFGFHNKIGFKSDILPDVGFYDANLESSIGWGLGEWGEFPWGDEDLRDLPRVRLDVPTQYRISDALTVFYKHEAAREHFAVIGFGISFRQLTDYTTRSPRP